MSAKGLRIIVCGGRDHLFAPVYAALTALHTSERGPIREVVHGGARGADNAGMIWACRHGIREWCVPAEWSKFGKGAGPRRNKKMIGMDIDLVVAFPGGRGTKNMTKIARHAGVEVFEPCGVRS